MDLFGDMLRLTCLCLISTTNLVQTIISHPPPCYIFTSIASKCFLHIEVSLMFIKFQIYSSGDFLAGSVVKNPPCNVRDAGLISCQRTKIPHAVGQLSPCITTTETMHHTQTPCATAKVPTCCN